MLAWRWNEAVNVFNFSNDNWEQFAAAVDSVDDAEWQPLWDFCNANADNEITGEELTQCAASAAEYVGMSEATQSFLYDFGVKYWNVVDQDGSGGLNYDEYKYTMGGFAAVDARVILKVIFMIKLINNDIIKAFDSDTNGLVEGDELTNWKNFVKGQLAENGWNPSEGSLDAMKAAWANAQSNILY